MRETSLTAARDFITNCGNGTRVTAPLGFLRSSFPIVAGDFKSRRRDSLRTL